MQLIRLLQGIQCRGRRYAFLGSLLPPSLPPLWSFLFSISSYVTLLCIPSHPQVGDVFEANTLIWAGLYETLSYSNSLWSLDPLQNKLKKFKYLKTKKKKLNRKGSHNLNSHIVLFFCFKQEL